jgi:hypothetical protein
MSAVHCGDDCTCVGDRENDNYVRRAIKKATVGGEGRRLHAFVHLRVGLAAVGCGGHAVGRSSLVA